MVAHTRFNSVRIGTRTRDLEDLDVDTGSWVSLFLRGFIYLALFIIIWCGDGCSTVLHECMSALCETLGDEPHDGVSKLHQSVELCFATQIQSGVRELCVEETPQQLSIARDSAPATEGGRSLARCCRIFRAYFRPFYPREFCLRFQDLAHPRGG